MLTPRKAFWRAEGAKEIVIWEPSKGINQSRLLAFAPAVHAKLSMPWGSENSKHEALRLITHKALDRIIEDSVTLKQMFKMLGKKSGNAELKVVSPDPGLRIPGRFLEEGVFVGLSIWMRDELPYHLDDQQTASAKVSWKEVMAHSSEECSRIFPEIAPFRPVSLTKTKE